MLKQYSQLDDENKSRDFKIFRDNQFKKAFKFYEKLFLYTDIDFQNKDLNLIINSDHINEIFSIQNNFSIKNHKVSLIFHDQPLYIPHQYKKIRERFGLDDIESLNQILLLNNQDNLIDVEIINNIENACCNNLFSNSFVQYGISPNVGILNEKYLEIKENKKKVYNENKNLNFYQKNELNQYQIPNFMLYRNKLSFSKEEIDSIYQELDHKGLNFQFDLSETAITHLLIQSDQTRIKLSFQSKSAFISDTTLESDSPEKYLQSKVPKQTQQVHIKILYFTNINQICFLYSKQEKINFDQFVQQNLHIAIQDTSQNTRVMANIFNIDLDDTVDSQVPILIQNTQKKDFQTENDEFADDFIFSLVNDQTDIIDSYEKEFQIEMNSELVGTLNDNESLFLQITKTKSNNQLKIGNDDFNRLIQVYQENNPEIEKKNNIIQMKPVIKFINTENNINLDIIIELKYSETFQLYFEDDIIDLVDIRVFKLNNEQYANNMIDKTAYDEKYQLKNQSINMFNLTRMRYFNSNQIYRFEDLDLWFLKGYQSKVLFNNFELVSNQKDSFRSNVLIRMFQDIYSTNRLELLINGLKDPTMQECIGSIQVDQNESLEQIDKHSNENSSFSVNESNISSSQIVVTNDNNTFIKEKLINSSVKNKSKKYFWFAEEECQFIRLIGFIFLFNLNDITKDFKLNKHILNEQFSSNDKQSKPFSINYDQCKNKSIIDKINSLPRFQLYILFKFSTEYMDRKIDWNFRYLFYNSDGIRKDYMVYVNLEKGFALVNSPNSQLFPLPAILQFHDQKNIDMKKEDILNVSDLNKEGIEYQIKAFINQETDILQENLLMPKQNNDIVQNTYFTQFDQAYKIKINIVNQLREISIKEEYTFTLLNLRILAISPNLRNKNDFMLIRYNNYKDQFEATWEFFDENRDEELKFNGINFKENDYQQYRVRNKKSCDEISNSNNRIVTLYMKVANRSFQLPDYLLGIQNNLQSSSIYDYEIVRDTIDQITQKYLITPYTIQVYLYVLTIILYLPMVQTQLSIVDPEKIAEQGQTGFLITTSTILLIIEIFFVIKLILEVIFMNSMTNQEENSLLYFQNLLDIVIFRTILSEKILTIANNAGIIQTNIIIQQNVSNNILIDGNGMKIILASCFICIFNLVNFMSQFSFTQKLVITLIEIFKDLRWTLFIAFILVLCLTCTVWGIECIKHQLIDAKLLFSITTSMSQTKGWIAPYQLLRMNWGETMQYTISLALMGDTYIFEEQNHLISLLEEEEISSNDSLREGIQIIESMEVMWQLIVIIVIVGQVVVLLNFMIAIMSDSYSKVTENFLMQTQKLKTSQMIEWHWQIQLMIHQVMGEDELQFQPWKIVLQNPDLERDEEWDGQVAVIKSQVHDQIREVEKKIGGVTKVCATTERKVDDLRELTLNSFAKLMQMINEQDKVKKN